MLKKTIIDSIAKQQQLQEQLLKNSNIYPQNSHY